MVESTIDDLQPCSLYQYMIFADNETLYEGHIAANSKEIDNFELMNFEVFQNVSHFNVSWIHSHHCVEVYTVDVEGRYPTKKINNHDLKNHTMEWDFFSRSRSQHHE